MPTRTVVKLRIRLTNQNALTRMSEEVTVESWGNIVERDAFAERSSWLRIWESRITDKSFESCFRVLWDSMTKAVTMAEKRPACTKLVNEDASIASTHEYQKILDLVLPGFTSSFVFCHKRSD